MSENLFAILHQKQIGMMSQLKQFFISNNISYFLLGGTLLGAIRHKGFIPWDDDIDLGIPRDDYEKLIKIADKLPKNLELRTHKNGLGFLFAKVYLQKSVLDYGVSIGRNQHHGIYIDIFPLDGFGNNYKEAVRYNKKLIFLRKMFNNSIYRSNFHTNGFVKRFFQMSYRIFSIIIPPKLILFFINRIIEKHSFTQSHYIGNFNGAWGIKELMDIEIFIKDGKIAYCEFEGDRYPSPINYDAYLTQLYGDYMTPPPIEKRVSKHLIKNVTVEDSEID